MAYAHLIRHFFDAELGEIRSLLLEMGGIVEQMIENSVRSVMERDSELAERTIAQDCLVNDLEVKIDGKCFLLLARRQPAARDLRFITFVFKVVTDLERIGDQCALIAGHALGLNRERPVQTGDLWALGETASRALRQALDAFVNGDVDRAALVRQDECLADQLEERIQGDLLTLMMADSSTCPGAFRINEISRYLESIADHAANIAEMVVFMVEGKDIRHSVLRADRGA
ncbi:phosphate signaling complex protein PhoU [Geomesophilobacter sediminis]|uniref:Phosphate-specific transport system accessory protein PhoU n=1 Tax=Geomesophilobacter sediminis TaxID=2798584 RepID=A0A8J7JC70_9BACT|nr:phosphate signaling complex protein PhoU [Geomesophilobacter sediminis]MBJ6724313.1 phosphate signaling complex protein PhoU [Geomesophilobacter sediminis]